MTSINKSQSPMLNLLDEIYRDPFLASIDAACENYHAARRAEEYADIKEEIEDHIADLDLDTIWESLGPDAHKNHYTVAIEARRFIAEENWLELGRLLGEGAKKYLRPIAADEIKARTFD